MHLSLSEWPLTQEVGGAQKVPEEELIRWKFAGLVNIIEPVIQYEKYRGKSFQFAVNVTARILRIAKHKTFKKAFDDITPEETDIAETYIIRNSMKMTNQE